MTILDGTHGMAFNLRWNEKMWNIRIENTFAEGQRYYYITNTNRFDSLYSLIHYYKSHPLKTNVTSWLFLSMSILESVLIL